MCVVNIRVDENRLRKKNSSFKDSEAITRWLQKQVDELIDNYVNDKPTSPCYHSAEEMHAILIERSRRAEAGEERIIPNETVFDSIRTKYGF